MSYTQRKPGLLDRQIEREKRLAVQASYSTHPASKRAVMQAMYGNYQNVPPEIRARLLVPSWAHCAHSFTERGDFTTVGAVGFV